MAPSAILFVFCIFLFHLQSTRGNNNNNNKQVNCNILRCGDIDIQFPFGLRGSNQDRRCRYYPSPSFQLWCLQGTQTILTLPGFGNLTVKRIVYESQSILVNNPDGCLPKHLLHNWNLSDSPFVLNPTVCGASPFNLTFLVWTEPNCGECALNGQVCGFSNQKTKNPQVRCFASSDSSKGVSRSAKYGLAIGVGIPGLLCVIGLSCFVCGKVRMLKHDRPRSTDVAVTISLEPVPLVMGLDGATIDKYPKTLIGESGRLLKPNDNTCSICLCEYQPKETLRSIPECNHYFHADCIDEWLKLNATCPLCRNYPHSSSTPSFSSFSSPSPH